MQSYTAAMRQYFDRIADTLFRRKGNNRTASKPNAGKNVSVLFGESKSEKTLIENRKNE